MAKVEESEKRLFGNDNKDKDKNNNENNNDKKFYPRYKKFGEYLDNFDKERIRLKERIWLITQEKNRILRNKQKNKDNKDINKDNKDNKYNKE